jgi:hypothetical protein
MQLMLIINIRGIEVKLLSIGIEKMELLIKTP